MPKPKKTKPSKYRFTLKNTSMRLVDDKYCFSVGTSMTDSSMPPNTTRLSELHFEKTTPELIPVIDGKQLRNCCVSMIDHSTNMDPGTLGYECYWCHYPFETRAIGCPIRFVHSQAVRTYYSETSRGMRTIKENITKKRKEILKKLNDPQITIEEADYYETDGAFCSFNCCAAFIADHKHDRMYDNSKRLLHDMYCDFFGVNTVDIRCAPSWRQRRESGGHFTATTFRDTFGKVEYEYKGPYFAYPYRPIGRLYEESYHF